MIKFVIYCTMQKQTNNTKSKLESWEYHSVVQNITSISKANYVANNFPKCNNTKPVYGKKK